jgi:hypothetical protein
MEWARTELPRGVRDVLSRRTAWRRERGPGILSG